MYFQSVIRITFLIILLNQFRIEAYKMVPHGCQTSCGDIDLAYPLGIGSRCAANQWFDVVCNKTGPNASERAFITSINAELIYVSFDFIRTWFGFEIKGPIISSNCSGRRPSSSLNITGSPFYFSTDNQFVAVGCNTRAAMTEIHPQIVGCGSTCETETFFDFNNCNGTNCCMAYIPYDLQVFDVRFDKLNTSIRRDECNLAFLPNATWLFEKAMDKKSVYDMDYVPLMLEWKLHTPLVESKSRRCVALHVKPNWYHCYCLDGYEGNPYLPNGDGCQGIAKRPWAIIIGTCLGFGVFFTLTGAWRLYKFIIKRKEIELRKKFFKRNGGLLLQQQLSCNEQGNIDKMRLFTSKELQKATDNFNDNRILGQGGQGTVYKGMLVDGRIVAVKKSKLSDEVKLEEFINEVVILSQINHRNVVKLLGCCLETEVPLLIYEYISNGNLYEFLQLLKDEPPMPWEMRLRVATEASGALSYLHSFAAIPIYHRDIKTTNILLDEKYRAKVSDFGISRWISIDQTHLTTNVKGTFGYFDPEYFRSSHYTDKSDVYSFGVVLVELLTGQKPISFARSDDCRSLAVHFLLLMEENRLTDLIDPHVSQECSEEEALAFANIAKRCLKLNGKNRPSMKEITRELQQISGFSEHVQTNHEDISNSREFTSSTGSDSFNNSVFSLDGEPLISDVPLPKNSTELWTFPGIKETDRGKLTGKILKYIPRCSSSSL